MLLCRLLLFYIYLFNTFFIFIWHNVYYSVISQKVCFYLVTGFKFFISKEIKIKIRIEKVSYSGNSSTKPCSKEDRNIINFNIFVVPYDRVSSTWLSIKLKPVLQCSYVEEW